MKERRINADGGNGIKWNFEICSQYQQLCYYSDQIKDDGLDRTHCMHGIDENFVQNINKKPELKRQLLGPNFMCEFDTKTDGP
jgi:hypothetical protein